MAASTFFQASYFGAPAAPAGSYSPYGYGYQSAGAGYGGYYANRR